MASPNGRVALITGCSSGIGYATALYLARRGIHVYATMRDPSKATALLEEGRRDRLPLEVLKLDVTVEGDIVEAVSRVVGERGRLDLLINNAGFGLMGPIEEVSTEELKAQFETNFFGHVRLIQEVAPIMRRQGSGYIVNISSAAGRLAVPFMGAYSAAKFALEGLSEALHHELAPYGVRVIIIEPGYIHTNFHRNVRVAAKALRESSPYATFMKRAAGGQRSSLLKGSGPEKVAKTIFKAISAKKPRLRYTAGRDAWMGTLFQRLLPERLFLWAIRRYYGLK
jgi:NAD(P)-dependent dehydrogenase (short-subunit alcohol dehydrogenase family)